MTTEVQAASEEAKTYQRPANLRGPIPYIGSRDGARQAQFYVKAFDGKILNEQFAEDGKRYMHCCIEIAGGHIMMSDAFPEFGHPYEEPKNLSIFIPSNDPQADFDRAVAAGCEVTMPMAVQFWGDRYGQLKDPWGIIWSIGGPA